MILFYRNLSLLYDQTYHPSVLRPVRKCILQFFLIFPIFLAFRRKALWYLEGEVTLIDEDDVKAVHLLMMEIIDIQLSVMSDILSDDDEPVRCLLDVSESLCLQFWL